MPSDVKMQLYLVGMRLSMDFLKVNKLPYPAYYTFAELAGGQRTPPKSIKLAYSLALNNPLVGGLTGFYREGCVCVNVPVTALPVDKPRMRSWSYPCWKTDRTAIGVVAHETGHYVEHALQRAGKLNPAEHGAAWRTLLSKYKKRVTSYEPRPSEAWAETLRLFILNPYLLKFGIPERYEFVRRLLKPSEERTWRAVLLDHPAYCAAGEKWIAK